MSAPHRARPLVMVDQRLARRRRTGIARVITQTREAMKADPPADMDIVWVNGPRGLPRRNALTSLGNLVIDMLWLGVMLPRKARKRGASLIHVPMNWGPLRGRTPTTVMIQDLAFERMPEAYPKGFRAWASIIGRRTAKRATLVMTTTEAGAHDVEEIYGVPRERIRVVHLGTTADEQSFQPPREPSPPDSWYRSAGRRRCRKGSTVQVRVCNRRSAGGGRDGVPPCYGLRPRGGGRPRRWAAAPQTSTPAAEAAPPFLHSCIPV